jgi:hypothetical protein
VGKQQQAADEVRGSDPQKRENLRRRRIAKRGDHQAGDDRRTDPGAHQDLLVLAIRPALETRAQPPPERGTSRCPFACLKRALSLLARHDQSACAIYNLAVAKLPLGRHVSRRRHRE